MPDYDSKKVTGSVGIKNPGATCYMNPLLQTLFHIPKFRKVMLVIYYYNPPAPSNLSYFTFQYQAVLCITNMLPGSIPLALQTLFYMLQYNETCVDSEDFVTHFFGGDNYSAFMHHDVQKLSRILLGKLEDSMKVIY